MRMHAIRQESLIHDCLWALALHNDGADRHVWELPVNVQEFFVDLRIQA